MRERDKFGGIQYLSEVLLNVQRTTKKRKPKQIKTKHIAEQFKFNFKPQTTK